MSSAQLSQILGYARADTFLKHYNSSKVRVDVQASFLGTPSKAALFKKVGQLRMRRSPDLPRALKPAEVKEIRESANIKKLLEQREQLRIIPCLADPASWSVSVARTRSTARLQVLSGKPFNRKSMTFTAMPMKTSLHNNCLVNLAPRHSGHLYNISLLSVNAFVLVSFNLTTLLKVDPR